MMKKNTYPGLTGQVKKQADEIKYLACLEDVPYGNLAGVLMKKALRVRGWYGYTDGVTGKKTLLILTNPKNQ